MPPKTVIKRTARWLARALAVGLALGPALALTQPPGAAPERANTPVERQRPTVPVEREWIIGSWMLGMSCEPALTLQFLPDGTLGGHARGQWQIENGILVIHLSSTDGNPTSISPRWQFVEVGPRHGEFQDSQHRGDQRGQMIRCPSPDPTITLADQWLVGRWAIGECGREFDYQFHADGCYNQRARGNHSGSRGRWQVDGNILTLTSAVFTGLGQLHIYPTSESMAVVPRSDDSAQFELWNGERQTLQRCISE